LVCFANFILKIQKNKLIAYKYLYGNHSPYKNFKYEIGKTYQIKTSDCETDETILCGPGLNVATLEWCLRDTNCCINPNISYIEVEFDPKDIVAIPYNSDGKFRVKKLKVIRKLSEKELEKALKPLNPSKEK